MEKVTTENRREKNRNIGSVMMLAVMMAALFWTVFGGLQVQTAQAGQMHNSNAFTSPPTDKWGGKWGLAGGKYGAFSCSTCHQPDAKNIKAIKQNFVFTNTSTWLETGTATSPAVVYLNATSMGSATEAGRTSSARVCEVCHTQTRHHRYNVTKNYTPGGVQPDTGVHFGAQGTQQCVACHPHNKGFAASCNSCHGSPPSTDQVGAPGLASVDTGATGATPKAGAHTAHYTTQGIDCTACHNNNMAAGHPNTAKYVKIGFLVSNSTWPSHVSVGTAQYGTYSSLAPASMKNGYSFASSDAGTVVANSGATLRNSCNVYCHGGWTGSNASLRPSWTITDGSQKACGTCHGVVNSKPPTSGTHTTHAGTSALQYNYSCTKCHPSRSNPNFTHVDGAVQLRFSSGGSSVINSGATYKGVADNNNAILNQGMAGAANNGQCTNLYCHSRGTDFVTPVAPRVTPAWGGASLDCAGCHGDAATGDLSGKHAQHVNNAAMFGTNNSYGCVDCHAKTVSDNTTISNKLKHINTIKDYSGARANDNYNSGTKSCTSVYCHSNGNISSLVYVNPAVWNSGTSYGCNGCHGTSNATTGAPDYANGGAATATANSHAKHVAGVGMADTKGCANCHYRTVSTTAAGALRNYSTLHINKSDDVAFKLIGGKTGIYNSGAMTCSTTYCHGTAASPAWGSATLACSACHGASSALPGAHNQHWEDATVATSFTMTVGNSGTTTAYRFSCSSCHSSPSATHAAGPGNVNGAAQVFFGFTSATRKGSYSYGGTSAGSDNGFSWTAGAGCQTSYCHSNGQGGAPANTTFTWATANGTLGCTGCHGDAASGTLSGKHAQHVNNAAVFGTNNSFGCIQCHAKTVSNNTTISNKLNHVNKMKDYSGLRAGGSSRYSTTTKQCTNIYCHSNGNPGALVYVNPAAWNSATSYGCNGCHGTSNANTGAPDYANSGAGNSANNHSKHVTALNITNTIGCAICHAKTANMTITGKFKDYTAASYHLNGTPSVIFDKTKAGASSSFSAGSCSNIICHGSTTPVWGQTSNCDYCHPRSSLSGAHQFHINAAAALPAVYLNLTGNKSAGSAYNYGCSICHPLTNASHATGTIVIDFRPGIANSGYLKSKNAAGINSQATAKAGQAYSGGGVATAGVTGTAGSSVICNNVYCHSNGGGSGGTVLTTPTYYATPDWYGTVTAAKDKCSMCHGNMPNSAGSFGARIGSPSHYNTSWLGFANFSSGHSLGLHDKNIYKGGSPLKNGLLAKQAALPTAHGNSTTATTFNCNACHNLTVTAFGNDKNNVCVKCHYSGNSVGALAHNPGGYGTTNDMQLIANTAFHVNGALNISFRNMTGLAIPAQVQDAAWPNYSSSWRRPNGYKSNAGNSADHWNPKKIPSYSAGTCSNIACHNGQSVRWNKATADPKTGGSLTCNSCHIDF